MKFTPILLLLYQANPEYLPTKLIKCYQFLLINEIYAKKRNKILN